MLEDSVGAESLIPASTASMLGENFGLLGKIMSRNINCAVKMSNILQITQLLVKIWHIQSSLYKFSENLAYFCRNIRTNTGFMFLLLQSLR